MNYFKDENGEVFAYTDEDVDAGYGAGMTLMTQEEVHSHLNPAPSYQQELASLNAEWQLKVDAYNKSFAISGLVDGSSEDVKKAAIRAAYEADKLENTAARAALKVKHGIGVTS